jgi:hypothetical protein
MLIAPVSGSAQRRHRTTTTHAPSAAEQTAEAERRAAAAHVADQIKTLSHFLYLLGGVVKSVEAVDRAVQESGASDADPQIERNKATIKQSIHNVQSGLNAIENDFSTKPSLRPYYHLVLGVSDLAGQAGQQADAGQFDAAGRSLLGVLDKLADALAAMRQTP